MCKKIFISTPIAGFENEKIYLKYKKVLEEIGFGLQKEFGKNNIYAAFLDVSDFNSYDSPEKSAKVDLDHLVASDYFILFYPIKVATSALTELGYALALKKKILIITPNVHTLPYMVQGLTSLNTFDIKILTKNLFEDKVIEDIVSFLNQEIKKGIVAKVDE